jgi:hypothetical protein
MKEITLFLLSADNMAVKESGETHKVIQEETRRQFQVTRKPKQTAVS